MDRTRWFRWLGRLISRGLPPSWRARHAHELAEFWSARDVRLGDVVDLALAGIRAWWDPEQLTAAGESRRFMVLMGGFCALLVPFLVVAPWVPEEWAPALIVIILSVFGAYGHYWSRRFARIEHP